MEQENFLNEKDLKVGFESDEGDRSKEKELSPEYFAAVTSVVMSGLGTPRPGEERHNAAVAMSQSAEIIRLLAEAKIELPYSLVSELQSAFAKIKEDTNFGVTLNDDVMNILEKYLSQNSGFTDIGLPDRETMPFLEKTMISAMGGAKAASETIAEMVGRSFIGSSLIEIRQYLADLRQALNIITEVQNRRWIRPSKAKAGETLLELPEANDIAEIISESGVVLDELGRNPITVEDMLRFLEIKEGWLTLRPDEQTMIIAQMQDIADILGASLVASDRGPIITVEQGNRNA